MPHLDRRHLLLTAAAVATPASWGSLTPRGVAGNAAPRPIRLPRDHGSHPEQRIEWWYVTGLLRPEGGAAPSHGFQLTFFRLRQPLQQPLDSAFSPEQLLLAHAALSDLGAQRLLHDQRLARLGTGLVPGLGKALAAQADCDLRLGDWQLQRLAQPSGLSRYRLTLNSPGAGFALALDLAAPLPPLLQGDQGLSRKGPRPEQFSRYLSEPQLRGRGELQRQAQGGRIQRQAVQALAWLDHEWSDQLLGDEAHPQDQAVGWDWLGANLDDGSALTLFQLRRADGSVLWRGGSWRDAQGRLQDWTGLPQAQLHWQAHTHWTSPLSQARYPTAWRLRTPRGELRLEAAFDAQEIDARRSTGFLYWEGAARLRDAQGQPLGWGYLEMTGYAGRVPL